MTMLKGGNVVGLVLPDGNKLMNENGAPLVFLIEDEHGQVHELQMTIGRMGTYAMFAYPPFRVEEQVSALETRAASERQGLDTNVPTARPRASSNKQNAAV